MSEEYANIIDYVEHNAKSRADAVAIAMGAERYTFSEMYEKAKLLSTAITCKNKPIVIIAGRSVNTILFFLAVAYSGNFYVPIDPELPEEKKKTILNETGAEYIFCEKDEKEHLYSLNTKAKILDIDSFGCSVHDPSGITRDTPLYMVYTSGSTGKPKGVLKTHGAAISFIESYVETFGCGCDEVIGNQTPFFFDASAKDILLMFKTGARLEVIPSELFVIPQRLIAYLNDKRVSYICWVPTALVLTARIQAFKYVIPQYLKSVHFVGEVMPVKYLNYWMNNLPDVRFVNMYGQSELCGIACYYEVRKKLPDDAVLPIGKPLANCKVVLRDGGITVTEAGSLGEIWISSDALAKGYYKDEEKTRDSFCVEDGIRLFKTGDYACYNEEGDMVFSSRKDSQIKHLGRRIELGEIEAVVYSSPYIERCCCLYDGERSRLVLFCQTNAEIEQADLIKHMSSKLPSYMIPGVIIFKKQLPINRNGKIDRQELKKEMMQ